MKGANSPPRGPAELGLADATRLISQLTDHAIVALDVNGVIESWNLGAQRLKGYTETEAVGRHFSVFYPDADQKSGLPQQLLQQATVEGRVEHTGWRFRADGSRFWGDVIITALHDDDGDLIGFGKVTRDRTQQHELEEDLRRSEERLRLLVEQVSDYAIFALSPTGVIESWNLGAERLKGYTHDQAIGMHFSAFYTPEDRYVGLPLQLLETARAEGRVEQTGWRVRADGTRFWADVIITAIHDGEGQHTGFAKVTRDLSARRRYDEARQRFFATFAHDFKTPLFAISGYAEMLPMVEGAERDKFLAKIMSNAQRLSAMTDELVDHSRLRSEEPEPVIEWLDTAGLAQDAVAVLRPGLGAERVRVDAPSLSFAGDRNAMLRILDNLVSNALKYSTHSGAPVVIDAALDGDAVVISVSDSGRGIAPKDLPLIFDEFERGELAEHDGGSGLGLTSVKALVNRLGGQIDISSEVGVGTTAAVRLPGRAATDSQQQGSGT